MSRLELTSNRTDSILSDLEICDRNVDYSFRSIPGVLLAAACYPVVVGTVLLAVSIWQSHQRLITLEDVFVMTCVVIGFSVLSLAAMVVTAVSATISVILLNGLNLIFGNVLDTRSTAGAVGGWAGYAVVAWALLLDVDTMFGLLPWILVLSTLAMFMGTFGAMTWLEKHYRYELELMSAQRQHRFQFRISQVLIATTMVAMVIGVAQLTKRLDLAVVICYWFFIQAVIVAVVGALTKRMKARPLPRVHVAFRSAK